MINGFYKILQIPIVFSVLFTVMGNAWGDDNLLQGADAGYGEYLSGECVACHHSEGASKGIPSITGWDAETFVIVMRAYRSKELDHNVMQMISGRLDDEQIASLAVYFASLPAAE
ncbi:MAG: c-type cytochrome [Candidatus Puniceispirillales bacterium]|jgi:cytochrome c553